MPGMLYKGRIDDRSDICYISICFYLVILNKVKLKNGLKCLWCSDLRQNGDTLGIHATCATINPVMADDK